MDDTILITGATGFLGGAILAKLLTGDFPRHPLLLVRGNCAVTGLQRVCSNLRRFGVPETRLDCLHADQIISGDFSDVAAFGSDARLETVSYVINCAAITSFSNHPDLWAVNVAGTLLFARQMREMTDLKRFLHVGTAMACGPQAGTFVSEDYVAPADVSHIVPYTQSKLAIERLLGEQLPTLPLLVVRPSIVVGDTRFGCSPSYSIFWVFRLAQILEQFTYDIDDSIDVVPVDYVADAILHLLHKPVLRHGLYHISAGKQGASTFREIDCALADGFAATPTAERYRRAAHDQITRRALQLHGDFSRAEKRLLLKAIQLYGAFAQLKMVFDNSRILDEGMDLPPRFPDYAGVCARSCKGVPMIRQMYADLK